MKWMFETEPNRHRCEYKDTEVKALDLVEKGNYFYDLKMKKVFRYIERVDRYTRTHGMDSYIIGYEVVNGTLHQFQIDNAVVELEISQSTSLRELAALKDNIQIVQSIENYPIGVPFISRDRRDYEIYVRLDKPITEYGTVCVYEVGSEDFEMNIDVGCIVYPIEENEKVKKYLKNKTLLEK
jgi:hypothetical protein